jgi:uncharacterized membrane protein
MLVSMNHALIESATFTKAFIALIPACMLFWGSTVQYFRWKKSASTFLQLLGAGCLVVVVVTHVFEALHVMSWMGWGMQHSIGHYLDLCSAVLAFTLFPAGYLYQALAKQR